jgi:hypothetical protein
MLSDGGISRLREQHIAIESVVPPSGGFRPVIR